MKKSFLMKITLLALAAAICGATVGAVMAVMRDFPEIRNLENFSPSAISRIYSSDKILLAEVYLQKRTPVSLEKVPDELKKALLSTEDRQFYKHSGLDLKGIFRALIHDIKTGSFEQGASTITQQLAKTLFLTPEKSLERKLKEAFLALQLERRYTKDEILELYLNQIYLGSGAYGVEMAARTYFSKPVSELNLAQCALIAGLPKAPSFYSPLINPEAAIKRRNLILGQMHQLGLISQNELEKACSQPYKEPDSVADVSDRAPYFVDYIKKQVKEAVGADMLYKGGITVYTTLSFDLQQAADKAVARGLLNLEKRMEKRKKVHGPPQAALVAIDVQTGEIKAMVGGNSYAKTQYNRAVDAKRQPGSAFKPVIYACALENGYDQDCLVLDSPVAFDGPAGKKDWRPSNFSGTYDGEITFRKALAMSKNIPAIRVLESIGPDTAIDFAKKMGIKSHLSPYLSLALGSFEVSLLELTAAYSVFPNQGQFIEPFGIKSIKDHRERVVWQPVPLKQIAMERTEAAIMTDMLKAVIREGTAGSAMELGGELAGKTGTTNQYRDALFIGFCPTLAAGVWVGNDDYTTLGTYETGARAALPIWKEFMKKALDTQPLKYFDFPDTLELVRIDPDTGQKVSSNLAVPARVRKTSASKP
jgi:penicillin-binding protein 1A